MTDLETRIGILEEIEAIRRQFMRLGELFDAPYDADGLTALFTEDGYLNSGGPMRGKAQIHAFFTDLAASFTLHYSTNGVIDVDPSLDRATGHWYGWETPVIDDESMLGGFSTDQEYLKIDGEWHWSSLDEVIHFLAAADAGWVKESTPRAERRSEVDQASQDPAGKREDEGLET